MTAIASLVSGFFSVVLWCVAFGALAGVATSMPDRWDDIEPSDVGMAVVLVAAGGLAGYGAWGLWP